MDVTMLNRTLDIIELFYGVSLLRIVLLSLGAWWMAKNCLRF